MLFFNSIITQKHTILKKKIQLYMHVKSHRESPRGVVANKLDCDIVMNEFKPQSINNVYIWLIP